MVMKKKMKRIGEIADVRERASIVFLSVSFSDIENIDWITIKATLASADAWSICRLGDYFVRASHHTRQRLMEQQHSTISNGEPMAVNDEADSSGSREDFDMLDDIYASQPLFRLMPQIPENSQDPVQPIIEAGQYSMRMSPRELLIDLRRRGRSNPPTS